MGNWLSTYPRPQMKRDSFLSLNGEWTANGSRIIVPFPPEAEFSRYEGEYSEELLYQREFEIPDGFVPPDGRVLLHFGAVDQLAYVFVNDRPAVRHDGGYLPFTSDITQLLKPGVNVLSVEAVDNLSPDYPYGKQKKKPGGMWYTPVSGIWQSVWIEAVCRNYIRGISMEPSLEGLTINVDSDEKEFSLEIDCGNTFFHCKTKENVNIQISNPHLWTCEDPFLYHAVIKSGNDTVTTYFALRTIEAREGGEGKCGEILLNGKPVFLAGVLDQGYFHGGHYIPEDTEEYEQDILRMKSMGFNMMRKHAKIEPDVYYEACDRLGMLVMQDIVHSGYVSYLFDTALPTLGFQKRVDRRPGEKHRKEVFKATALETMDFLHNHPCVIAYTIFNEGWGQFDSDEMYAMLSSKDSTRFYDSTSGWFAQEKSDVDSKHVYFHIKDLHPQKRPMILSECGGFAYLCSQSRLKKKKYGYGEVMSETELTDKIVEMAEKMVMPQIGKGLCGYVYTQLSDIEDEINGLYTFDRSTCKVDPDRIEELNIKMRNMI